MTVDVYESDEYSFIFSLDNKTKHVPYQRHEYAICSTPGHMIVFGYNDIVIKSPCNTRNDSYSLFGSSNMGTFSLPAKETNDSYTCKTYLAGAKDFSVLEIEVFLIEG